MDKLTLIIDEIEEKLYELDCIAKCLYKVAIYNISRGREIYFLAPITKIVFKKFKKFSVKLDELSDYIYKKALKIEE